MQIGESVDFTRSNVATLDLSGSKIDGELRLANVRWTEDARLFLRNAYTSVLHENGCWPRRVELDGFTYDHIGGIGETDGRELSRKVACERYIKGWLEHDPTYTSQPYEQLADVFRRAGEPEWASDVLYASRRRAEQTAAEERIPLFSIEHLRVPTWHSLGMRLLNWTIGYGLGYRYFRCLWWILGFTVLGTGILFLAPPPLIQGQPVPENVLNPANYVVYSLVRLLPFFTLDEFKDVSLSSFAKWYFYFHQLVGWVLAGWRPPKTWWFYRVCDSMRQVCAGGRRCAVRQGFLTLTSG